MKHHLLSAVLLFAFPVLATAQSLPRPAEFYFEADAAQRPVLTLKDESDVAIARLTRQIARKPGAHLETAQLAHFAMRAGRPELGRELYARALRSIGRTSALWRPVTWTHGWDLYRSGDPAGALVQWEPLVSQYGARPLTASWMPPTLALVLWTLGRRDEAVQWYAAAVRTEPGDWSTSARHAELLPDWRDAERATLAEVQAAWAANPPAWP